VWDGNLLVSGFNPYLSLPSDMLHADEHGSILYEQMNSANYYSVYPPVSQFVFGLASWLSTGSSTLGFFLTKALFGLLELIGLLLLTRMVQWRGLILYAWNPVVMVETWGQGHTEAAAVGLLLLGLWAIQNQRQLISLVGFTLAGWVKLYPLLLVPFVLQRVGWRYSAVPIVLTALVWLPFAYPPEELISGLRNISQSVKLYSNLFEFNAGIYYSVRWLLDDVLRPAITDLYLGHHVGKIMQAIFLLWCCVLFWIDREAKRPMEEICIWIIGGFILLSTTIHPWYFVLICALAALAKRVPWSLFWLAAASQTTYLGYSHDLYIEAVAFVWLGWIVLVVRNDIPLLIQHFLRIRARNKSKMILNGLVHIEPSLSENMSVLDVGAAEGYVGEEIAARIGSKVELLDIIDLNKSKLPLTTYDGLSFPFQTNSKDIVTISYALHLCQNPQQVLAEAIRVSRTAVVVLESVDRNAVSTFLLYGLAIVANRVRSGLHMKTQEENLYFRSSQYWVNLVNELGGKAIWSKQYGSFFHPQFAFVIIPEDVE
jgi:ubiquinone/menaquinone biosynthesis C-methylase UbiE